MDSFQRPGSGVGKLAKAKLARLLVKGGDEAGADSLYDELVGDANICEDESLPWAVFQVAEEYYNKGFALRDSGDLEGWRAELGKAREMWERLGERIPEGYANWNLVGDLWYFTGVCCRITGDYVGALGYYEGILRDYPSYRYAWSAEYLRAGCIERLMEQGAVPAAEGFAEIEKCYERVVNEYTGCGSYRDALRNLGLLNYRRRDSEGLANFGGDWSVKLVAFLGDLVYNAGLYSMGVVIVSESEEWGREQ